MDRTILNLLSLTISGSGLFVVPTKFNVPELNMSFFGENPFAIKRDAIDNVMTWIFTCLALLGVVLQICGEIWSDRFPERQHQIRFYAWIALGSVAGVIAIVFLLTAVGNRIAKYIWLPVVINQMKEGYAQARFIVEHDGWRADQIALKDTLPDPAPYRRANLKTVEDRIAMLEKLLDLSSGDDELRVRIENSRRIS